MFGHINWSKHAQKYCTVQHTIPTWLYSLKGLSCYFNVLVLLVRRIIDVLDCKELKILEYNIFKNLQRTLDIIVIYLKCKKYFLFSVDITWPFEELSGVPPFLLQTPLFDTQSTSRMPPLCRLLKQQKTWRVLTAHCLFKD